MKTILDIIPKEMNQTHNWMACPNGKLLLTKCGTVGRERGSFFIGLFKNREEALKYCGEKNPYFANREPGALKFSSLSFNIYDYGHANFWAVITNETLMKRSKKNGDFMTTAIAIGLPKFVAVRCTTMGSAMDAIEEFCKYTGFKKGKVTVIHVIPSFDEDGNEVQQG